MAEPEMKVDEIKDDDPDPLLPGDSVQIHKSSSHLFGQIVRVTDPDWAGGMVKVTWQGEVKSYNRRDLSKVDLGSQHVLPDKFCVRVFLLDRAGRRVRTGPERRFLEVCRVHAGEGL